MSFKKRLGYFLISLVIIIVLAAIAKIVFELCGVTGLAVCLAGMILIGVAYLALFLINF